ncbi:FAD binding domain-containing protein [Aureimonas mangrovi]|uniref:FAD binding domain-containing protein n=1 Tax=Aureimonas mangrovi TaxID=2758041 RepID=UPI00163D984B|nr:xanthine dehydrogenase family protein subunit M [Aureimonas mangrovi]
MIDFDYARAASLKDASARSAEPGAMLLAGGTTLVDLAKLDVLRPSLLVDITRLPGLDAVEHGADGVTLGAIATMGRVAADPRMQADYPALAESLQLAASAQLRNMATLAGNLMQRTRCSYYRDPAAYPACNKREPGSGCSALEGPAGAHAVLGASPSCIALYPGDFAVALTALDALIRTDRRALPVADLFLEPGDTPQRETVLEPGEVITAIEVARTKLAARSTYLKVRERQSYEFASASAAVALELEEDGRTVRQARVALGGVATRPWRAVAVEKALAGRTLSEATVREASALAMEGAVPVEGSAWKIELVPRVVARAIMKIGGLQ